MSTPWTPDAILDLLSAHRDKLLNDPVAESLWSDADAAVARRIDILSRGFQAD